MRATFCIANPDVVEASMTITLPISAWRKLAELQESHWPAWELAAVIRKMIMEATKSYAESGSYEH